jgi:hypothetical protein
VWWKKGSPKNPPTTHWAAVAADYREKIRLVSDGAGVSLAARVTAGQTHESTQFEETMNAVRIP